MKNKLVDILKTIKQSKRALYLIATSVLILFCLALNITFSAFTSSSKNMLANIKVGDLEYSLSINGIAGTIITVPANDITKFNIGVASLNQFDTKYELTYEVCSDKNCTTTLEQPTDLIVDYSSRTIDSVNDEITPSGQKSIRIVTTNTSSNIYYIKLMINAGYRHNTLALENKMGEYIEDDVVIAAYIYGEFSTTFPTTTDYGAEVECHQADGSASNASGKAIWNGEKWVVTVENVDKGETRCNVYFGEKVDKEPPVLTITSPTGTTSSAPLILSTNTTTITGTTSDESGIGLLTVNGTAVTVNEDGTWSTSITLEQDVVTTVTVVSIDAAGNSTTATCYVLYEYKRWLYKNGEEYVSITGGWYFDGRYASHVANLKKGATAITGYFLNKYNSGGTDQRIITSKAVDVRGFKKLRVNEGWVSTYTACGLTIRIGLYDANNKAIVENASSNYLNIESEAAQGSHYVQLWGYGGDWCTENPTSNINITEIWLER